MKTQKREEKKFKNLKALDTVERIANNAGTTAYIWGGLTSDICCGSFLREHDDTEHLVLDLHVHRKYIQDEFNRLGWITKVLGNDDLKAERAEIKIHLGNVRIKNHRAYWYHNGNKGYISFPDFWLVKDPVHFMNITVHVVKPEFQYVLKSNPRLMNPEWKLREKDTYDRTVLREILKKRGVSLDNLFMQVNSIVT